MTKQRKEPRKFYFVDVEPKPCGEAELSEHLEAFGLSFVSKRLRDRWDYVTKERPDKAKNELAKIASEIDKGSQTLLSGSEGFPEALHRRFGNLNGIYFDGVEEPCKISAAEAASLAAERDSDALFSVSPGKSAIFFYHGGDVVLIQK